MHGVRNYQRREKRQERSNNPMTCTHKIYTKDCSTCEDILSQCDYNAHEGWFDMDEDDLTNEEGWARCRSFWNSVPDDYDHEDPNQEEELERRAGL